MTPTTEQIDRAIEWMAEQGMPLLPWQAELFRGMLLIPNGMRVGPLLQFPRY